MEHRRFYGTACQGQRSVMVELRLLKVMPFHMSINDGNSGCFRKERERGNITKRRQATQRRYSLSQDTMVCFKILAGKMSKEEAVNDVELAKVKKKKSEIHKPTRFPS